MIAHFIPNIDIRDMEKTFSNACFEDFHENFTGTLEIYVSIDESDIKNVLQHPLSHCYSVA